MEEGGEFANLHIANLSGANLSRANLRIADLSGADLSGADLDLSCLPLWCGSLSAHFDDRQLGIAEQERKSRDKGEAV